jgi:hypothetical protein
LFLRETDSEKFDFYFHYISRSFFHNGVSCFIFRFLSIKCLSLRQGSSASDSGQMWTDHWLVLFGDVKKHCAMRTQANQPSGGRRAMTRTGAAGPATPFWRGAAAAGGGGVNTIKLKQVLAITYIGMCVYRGGIRKIRIFNFLRIIYFFTHSLTLFASLRGRGMAREAVCLGVVSSSCSFSCLAPAAAAAVVGPSCRRRKGVALKFSNFPIDRPPASRSFARFDFNQFN